jgi:predicted ATPase
LQRAEKSDNKNIDNNLILRFGRFERRDRPHKETDMAQLSREMRRLESKWLSGTSWPQQLEWLKISGLRGWNSQRIDFKFPLIAVVGENGTGKSTILQAAASVYRSNKGKKETFFPTDFFPDTPWDEIKKAKIEYSVREDKTSHQGYIHKPAGRWREVPERRRRSVQFIDLGRVVPMASLLGYSKLARLAKAEARRAPFDAAQLVRLSDILGRQYDDAAFSLSDADSKRWVPVVSLSGAKYSGYHQGAGEVILATLLRNEIPKYSLVLIDELETSLHPRAQRRLIRDLADICRVRELQIVVTTHSPYILEELPPEGRIYILSTVQGKQLVTGVSSNFAMTQMDEECHPEADIYVEDDEARILLEEMIVAENKDFARRCHIVPYGVASVGRALGQMVAQKRWPRPTIVFLDADQEESSGCHLLPPGDDAPERVVFEALKQKRWHDIANRVARPPSDVIDALELAMSQGNHHDWVKTAANRLQIGSVELWRAMASSWASDCVSPTDRAKTVQVVQDTIDGLTGMSTILRDAVKNHEAAKQAASEKLEKDADAIPPPTDEPLLKKRRKSDTSPGLFD